MINYRTIWHNYKTSTLSIGATVLLMGQIAVLTITPRVSATEKRWGGGGELIYIVNPLLLRLSIAIIIVSIGESIIGKNMKAKRYVWILCLISLIITLSMYRRTPPLNFG